MSGINVDEFNFGKINALAQFHIVRRLAPIIGELIAVVASSGIAKSGKKAEDIKFNDLDFDAISKEMAPLLAIIAKLPDEDMNYCLFGLLKPVQRKIPGGGWAKIVSDQNHFMYDDIKENMQLMLMLAGKSFGANISGFINALPSGLKEGALKSKPIG